MGEWNLGSLHDEVLTLVPNVPSAISGATLLRIADRQRQHVSDYTGKTIGSNSIGIQYQEAILQFTISKVTKDMLSTNSKWKLGDFSTDTTDALKFLYASSTSSARDELQVLGRKMSYYKANG